MKYYVKKLVALIITLFIVTILAFVIFSVIPGDSATSILGGDATEEQLEAMREELGLKDGVLVRYGRWMKGVMTGDFGISTRYQLDVSELISKRLPITLGLTVIAFLLILLIAFPIGIFCTGKRGSINQRLVTFFTQLGMSIPPFFLGIIVSLVFGVLLKWFVPGGYIKPLDSFIGYIKYMVFPSLAIAIPRAAMLIRFIQTSILKQRDMEYVKTARSKGLSDGYILIHHILKNAIIPVIAFLTMSISDIMVGSIFVEQVFNLPGIGVLLVSSILSRDYNVIQAIILLVATIVIVMQFIADLLYQWIDPRIQYEN